MDRHALSIWQIGLGEHRLIAGGTVTATLQNHETWKLRVANVRAYAHGTREGIHVPGYGTRTRRYRLCGQLVLSGSAARVRLKRATAIS